MKKRLLLLAVILLTTTSYAQPVNSTIDYVYPLPASFKAKFVLFVLGLTSKNKSIKALETNTVDSTAAKIPARYVDEFIVETTHIQGRPVYTLSPKSKRSSKAILYLHGGAYIQNISKLHWTFIGELIRKTNCTVVVPDYPLAPYYTVKNASSFVEQVYKTMLTKTASDQIIFMGDSAGGGFALALAQKTKQDGGPGPKQIILFSPWLDITTSNPAMVLVEKRDPVLSILALQAAAKAYVGDLNPRNYLVSPLYGDLTGLGTISLFIGGRDIFIADARLFKHMMQEKGVALNYFYYPQMPHVWVGAGFLKESKVAFGQITDLINAGH